MNTCDHEWKPLSVSPSGSQNSVYCTKCTSIQGRIPILYDSTTREIDKTLYEYLYARSSIFLKCKKCRHSWSISEYEPLDGCPACTLHTDKVEGDGTFFLGGKL